MGKCGRCGSDDGRVGYTIGSTLCPTCLRERSERRLAYAAWQDRQMRQEDIIGWTIVTIMTLFVMIVWVESVNL